MKAIPRPFTKWVGGKGLLLPVLLEAVDAAGDFERYHEPFVGGGALFFELARRKRLNKHAQLYDSNADLVHAYNALSEWLEALIHELKWHQKTNAEDHFYEIRDWCPKSVVSRAARLIYLLKTCFNGLYRENSSGQFNSSWGSYKNPKICDEENLRACAKVLKKARIHCLDFQDSLKLPKAGDLVYLDPPYDPVSRTANFTAFTGAGFNEMDQRILSQYCHVLNNNGVHFILSNSDTGLMNHLYKDFHIKKVQSPRRINSDASKRGNVTEILVTNFHVDWS